MVGECHGQRVKIVLSFGLVALAFCAALLVVVGERIAPRIEDSLGISVKQSIQPGGVSYDDMRNAPLNAMPVNAAAATEVKRGDPNCPTCPQVVTRRPLLQPRPTPYVQPRPVPIQPPPNPPVVVQPSTNAQPSPSKPPAPTAAPTSVRYSLALFLGNDLRSRALESYFETDPRLKKLKDGCNFQTYDAANPLYLARYSSVIPPDQFPAILFSDYRGGHVYIAGGDYLPAQASQLYDEMQAAYRAQKQAVEARNEIALQSISLDPSNQERDCPDGNCSTPRKPLIQPSQPVFPNLFHKPTPTESLLHAILHPGESLLIMLCAVLFTVLLVVVLVKVIKS